MEALNLVFFAVFVVTVIGVGIWKGKSDAAAAEGEQTDGAKDYFLAGGKLTWYLIGFSLIAANISTEQFVGMSGKSADWLGMAIASYEWFAAVTLVVVGFVFLPKFLKAGIYTIPEYLEKRYSPIARLVMAIATMIILVGVPTASVIYSGGKVVSVYFAGTPIIGDLAPACYLIAAFAAVYVFVGGLKACAWTDLVWGSSLIIGGAIIMWLAFAELGSRDAADLIHTKVDTSQVQVEELEKMGAWDRFWALNDGEAKSGDNGAGGKLHMKRPIDDPEIPWTTLIVGLWIPNFFYWGLNQYIMQRTLGSKSLAEGQKGIVFAALLKLIIPFIVVIPGILAYNLFRDDLRSHAEDQNAEIMAAGSPALYATMSDDFKALHSDDPREEQVYARVEKALAAAKKNKADETPTLFTFPADFVGLFPEDAARILASNEQIALDLKVPVEAEAAKEEAAQDAAEPTAESALPGAAADAIASVKEAADQAVSSAALAVHDRNELVVKAIEKHSKANPDLVVETKDLTTRDYDAAFPVLLAQLLRDKPIIPGFVLAAIFGAVVSSLASMLNSASTIATMDIVNEGSKKLFDKPLSDKWLVQWGRIFVVAFVLIAAIIAPMLGSPAFGGIFTFIQEFQGFISPGILAIFIFGLLVKRAPRICGVVGLVLNPILYGFFKWFGGPMLCDKGLWFADSMSFLDRMGICFFIVMAVLTVLTIAMPLKEPIELEPNENMDVTTSKPALFVGLGGIAITAVLYIIFW